MKVGIWGSYDKGNFGDDLMAYMVANKLAAANFEPIIFNATPELANEAGCETIADIKSFVNEVDIVAIGGGGMLVNNSMLRVLVKKEAFDFEMDFYKLYTQLKRTGKQLIPISIGGGGNTSLNNPYKKKLFSKPVCKGGTVRLKTDFNTVSSDLFTFYPDIVLSTGEFFTSSKPATGKPRLILNLKKVTSEPLVIALLSGKIKERYEIITFGSHLSHYEELGSYEYKLKDSHFQYTNLKEAAEFLGTGSCVISSKLHVGVTAISMGTPFISYCGPAKAKEFLKSVNLNNNIADVPNQVEELLASAQLNDLSVLTKYKKQSNQHYPKLISYL